MNKWIKNSMASLVVGASALTISAAADAATCQQPSSLYSLPEYISVDALDYAGGSKLKDRMYNNLPNQQAEIVRALIHA